ncbi:MAG: DinB family protein [Chloroflexi bacterium]|nr:DinB family protein [Chloroflexota bacterium]MDA1241316.1 DinB family protein [Chloroflexota bacterium]
MTFARITWPYIENSIDRLVDLAASLTPDERAHRPDFDGANSIATLTGHTIANAEDNLLGTLLGDPVAYDRERDFDAPETDIEQVRARWERVRAALAARLDELDDARLLTPTVHPRRGEITGAAILVVVARHAAEHLAHAELTRDLIRSGRAAR